MGKNVEVLSMSQTEENLFVLATEHQNRGIQKQGVRLNFRVVMLQRNMPGDQIKTCPILRGTIDSPGSKLGAQLWTSRGLSLCMTPEHPSLTQP